MRKIIAFLFGVFWTSQVAFGAEPTTPIDRIAPEDVVQDSIKVWRIGTNKFTVAFTYSEVGAKKTLDFSEAQAGQKVRRQVGDYLFPEGICYAPPDPGEYQRWKEGWLKLRTSKFCGVSEADAEAIVAGLEGKTVK